MCTGFASMGSPGFALKGERKRDVDVPEIKQKSLNYKLHNK